MLTNQAIRFLRERFELLDPFAEEISFSNGAFEEIFYNLRWQLTNAHRQHFDHLIEKFFADIPAEKIEAISYQMADGKVYAEDKVMLLLNGGQRDCFLYPEINCFDAWIDYCMSVGVHSRKRIVKFYDMSRKSYDKLLLPDNTVVGKRYGVGVGVHPDVVGIYLLSEDYEAVVDFYQMPDPVPQRLKALTVEKAPIHPFGIVFNERTGEVLKLNYYFYHDYQRDDADYYLREIQHAKERRKCN